MKKLLMAAFFALVISAAAFTQFKVPELKLSAGGGGYFTAGLGGGVEASGGGYSGKLVFETIGGGGFAFFDATFVEVAVGFSGGGSTAKITSSGGDATYNGSYMALDLSVLGKWPFEVGPVVIFPLVGFDYKWVLSAETEGQAAETPADLSQFWINLGGGVDYPITDALYIRGEILYGIRFLSKAETDYGDSLAASGLSITNGIGHGPTIKVAVGYKF